MEYLTTAEIAQIWNISQRRVAVLCKEGRVNGAVLKGNMWLIPDGAVKPTDPRSLKNNAINSPNDNMLEILPDE